jgi:hypothetical protein
LPLDAGATCIRFLGGNMLAALLIAALVGPAEASDSAPPAGAVVEVVEVVVGILGPGDHWPI